MDGREFRLRRRDEGHWKRISLDLQPRSACLLDGRARWEWEHSIARANSITFRNCVGGEGEALGRLASPRKRLLWPRIDVGFLVTSGRECTLYPGTVTSPACCPTCGRSEPRHPS
jgi:hypothetical protein